MESLGQIQKTNTMLFRHGVACDSHGQSPDLEFRHSSSGGGGVNFGVDVIDEGVCSS
jgi:hypothetical protein